MRTLKCIINAEEHTIKFLRGGRRITLTMIHAELSPEEVIKSTLSVIIDPNTIAKVYIDTSQVEEGMVMSVKGNLQIGDVENGVLDRDTKFIWISNPTDKKLLIQEGTQVARVKPVPTEQIGNISEEESPETMLTLEQAKKLLEEGNLTNKERKEIWVLIKKYQTIFKQQVDFDGNQNKLGSAKLRIPAEAAPVTTDGLVGAAKDATGEAAK